MSDAPEKRKLLAMLLCVAALSCATVASPAPPDAPRQPYNGTQMVLVPAGPFTMGANDSEDDEKPAHRVVLDAYYIGKTAVSNAQFRKFVNATGYRASGDWQSCASKWGDAAPVVEVSWNDAAAYCRWAGLRLPSEAEWEKAARGTDGRNFPWGNTWDASRCNNSVGPTAPGPVAVDGFPRGASPYGCLGMSGNVWEWCASRYLPYPYNGADGREDEKSGDLRVLRGGSFDMVSPTFFRCSDRIYLIPTLAFQAGGFRCAKSL